MRIRKLYLFLGGGVLLLGALAGWQLQGPVLPAYELSLRPLQQVVVATGRVSSLSRTQIGSEITGVVLERRVQEGDVVKAGDVLVVLRSDDLNARVREAQAALQTLEQSTRPQAAAALRQAEAQLAQALREHQRRSELFAQQLVSRETVEQSAQAETVARSAAERARLAVEALAAGRSEPAQLRERLQAAVAAQARSVLRSPASGVVLTRNVEPGDLVQPGRVLLEIALQGDTEIVVPVDEKNLSVLALGQSAQCVTDAWPQRPFAARLNFIAPSIDAQRGVVELRLKVDPVPGYLRQDMTVSVNILTAQRAQALAVPNDALVAVQGTAATVLLVRGGRLTHVPVQLGLRGLALTEVVKGLAPGDRVLAGADAQQQQADGKRVRVALQLLPDPADSTAGQRSELPVKFD